MHLACPELSRQSGIRHGFFTRRGGSSTGLYASLNCGYGSGDDLETVARNRTAAASQLGVPLQALCTAYQIHSPQAVVLKEAWHWEDAPEADALVTRTPGIALGILTADCLPILLADPARRVIAAAHAGWKGAVSGIIEATLEAMTALGARRENIAATIGPAIAQASYEVGGEFRERFLAQDAGHQRYFIPGQRPGHFLFDLKSYGGDRLRAAGVGRINLLANDTRVEENDFFSYRRSTLRQEPVYGRQLSAIVLEEQGDEWMNE